MAASQSLPCFHFLMEDKLANCVGAAASEVKNIICSTALNLFFSTAAAAQLPLFSTQLCACCRAILLLCCSYTVQQCYCAVVLQCTKTLVHCNCKIQLSVWGTAQTRPAGECRRLNKQTKNKNLLQFRLNSLQFSLQINKTKIKRPVIRWIISW